MRHYPDLETQVISDTRVSRLFELHRQRAVQSLLNDAGETRASLRPDIALAIRERAIRSLKPDHS